MKTGFTNLRQFNRELNRYARELLPREFAAFFRMIGIELFSGILMKTPVGDPTKWKRQPAIGSGYAGGRAKGNWIVSLNSYPEGYSETRDETGQATLTKGMESLAKLTIGDVIYITNNLPYIEELEKGHSRSQAPHGMVAVTLHEVLMKYGGV